MVNEQGNIKINDWEPILLQLPQNLPFEKKFQDETKTHETKQLLDMLAQEGLNPKIGKLKLMKSGRVILTLNEENPINIELSQGTELKHFAELMRLDKNTKQAYIMRQVFKKVTGQPVWDELLA